MSQYPFRVHGIVWAQRDPALPSEATVLLSNWLIDLGPEDYEPQGFLDQLERLDEEETDDFWDNYQPSAAAEAALNEDWDREIKTALAALHNQPPLSFSGYERAQSALPE